MLVDAAKQGDVEIPYFCYEPKLGQPVGACRMCLVEIEGIPKLQTSCSTPVKDGMVVHTQSDRVRHAQNAIVEFLLINHPLDCPVCDKGGECPLQDITFGWGLGRSRMIEPKRHFAEAAGAVAADRDRPRALHPLLPLRALLAGDRRGLPADLRRARRAHVRRNPRRPPLRGAVQRQHRRAVPGRRADLAAVPVPRPAVGHRGRRRNLHAVPVAVQRHLHGPRRPRRARPGARLRGQQGGRRRLAVRQGPLRLPGDPRRRADHQAAGARRRRAARGLLGARARDGRRTGQAPGPGRRAGRRPGDQRGGLPAPAADARGAATRPTSTRARAAAPARRSRERWPRRRCRRASPTSSSPTRCCWSAASRSTTRRSSTCGSARACGATASSSRSLSARPSALDRNAKQIVRCAPGDEPAQLAALEAALGGSGGDDTRSASWRSCCATAARTS